MNEVTFSLAISHTPWVPERVASIHRLLGELGSCPSSVRATRVIDEPGANHEWSEHMWQWAAQQDVSHCVFLQDDARVPPHFWSELRSMVASKPDEIIGLEVVHPLAVPLAKREHRWFSTSDGLVGVGYVMPREVLLEFLIWRSRLEPASLLWVTEDTLIGLFALTNDRRICHPLPTIIDHDVSLASTYGNDAHSHRRPPVRWDNYVSVVGHEVASYHQWAQSEVPHVGRFYDSTPDLALRHVPGVTVERWRELRADTGLELMRRLNYEQRAAAPAARRIALCTPVRGGVSPAYMQSVEVLGRDASIALECDWDLEHHLLESENVSVARARLVRKFLETDATHLFFVDADVEFTPTVLHGMLAANRDFVAAPYPRRDMMRWDTIGEAARGGLRELEAAAYFYGYMTGPGCDSQTIPQVIDEARCVPIEGIGLGCALLSRAMLERMVDFYGHDHELAYSAIVEQFLTDGPLSEDRRKKAFAALLEETARNARLQSSLLFNDGGKPTVALFHLMLEGSVYMSEDISFCRRWRELGGEIWMYLGPGAPVTHHGEHAYRGHPGAFGLRHTLIADGGEVRP